MTPEHSELMAHLYHRYYRRLVRLAHLMVGPSQAEDLAQDAFVKALRRWDSGGSPETFWPWASTVLVRICLNARRRWRREVAALARLGTQRPLDSDPETSLDVIRALTTLSPRQRAAVVFRYFDDLSEAEVAARLGCRLGTAKALLSQARKRLRIVEARAKT